VHTTNLRRKEQLGIPFGTAMGKLRKNIMFSLVRECGKDVCVRCGKRIKHVGDFTIDHIEPWLEYPENNNKKFWDLDNIGFSHRKCNVPHRYRGPVGHTWNRKIGPSGTAWCYRCENFVDINGMVKRKARWNGCDTECLKCKRSRS